MAYVVFFFWFLSRDFRQAPPGMATIPRWCGDFSIGILISSSVHRMGFEKPTNQMFSSEGSSVTVGSFICRMKGVVYICSIFRRSIRSPRRTIRLNILREWKVGRGFAHYRPRKWGRNSFFPIVVRARRTIRYFRYLSPLTPRGSSGTIFLRDWRNAFSILKRFRVVFRNQVETREVYVFGEFSR